MSVMDLSGVLDDFSTGGYVVARATTVSAGSDGRASAPSRSTITVRGVVIPMNGNDLQRLPEGLRTKTVQWFYSTVELKAGTGGFEPDIVTIDGRDWQVQSAMPFSTLGNYWQMAVMQVGN